MSLRSPPASFARVANVRRNDLAVDPNSQLLGYRLEIPVHPVVIVQRHHRRRGLQLAIFKSASSFSLGWENPASRRGIVGNDLQLLQIVIQRQRQVDRFTALLSFRRLQFTTRIRSLNPQSLIRLQILPLESKCLARARPAAAEELENYLVSALQSVFQALNIFEWNGIRVALAGVWEGECLGGILRHHSLFDRLGENRFQIDVAAAYRVMTEPLREPIKKALQSFLVDVHEQRVSEVSAHQVEIVAQLLSRAPVPSRPPDGDE